MRPYYKLPRLFADHPLAVDATISLPLEAAHYLQHVLRLKTGDNILIFNGSEGEWLAEITIISKKQTSLSLLEQLRPQPEAPNLHYCFAPLKVGRLDYMIQKAVEMGASVLQPVLTQHCQMPKINTERMRSNAQEAAEQCGILTLPECRDIVRFDRFIDQWDHSRKLIFCDEAHNKNNPIEILQSIKDAPVGLLVGPEGGFSEEERQILRSLPFVVTIPLGPRILRADTAAVAAMAIIQATIGDWR